MATPLVSTRMIAPSDRFAWCALRHGRYPGRLRYHRSAESKQEGVVASGGTWRSGITAYGAYLPSWRLDRQAIAIALGAPAGRGTRSVASYDEDTTTLGVEAARIARAGDTSEIGAVVFATVAPAYLDKANAAAVHAALGLHPPGRGPPPGGS